MLTGRMYSPSLNPISLTQEFESGFRIVDFAGPSVAVLIGREARAPEIGGQGLVGIEVLFDREPDD